MHWKKAEPHPTSDTGTLPSFCTAEDDQKEKKHLRGCLFSFPSSAKSLISFFQTIEDFVAKVTLILRTQISSRVITNPG